MSFCYLASPYSHESKLVRMMRYTQVCHMAARMIRAGQVVFSPICHSHGIETIGMDEAKDAEFWMRQDLPMLRLASKLVVLMLPGWLKSAGIAIEIEEAKKAGIPVEYVKL